MIMKVSLLTDAPKHNLALMKLSTWHKAQGNEVRLNMPLWRADLTYASVLFDWNRKKFFADYQGGPAFLGSKMDCDERPDYSLFGLDYSLGYTYRYCPRRCPFCKVWKMETDKTHRSIHEFHDSRFNKICLLNNNTLADPRWKETFEEIWDAGLTVIDENGYDLRLMDEEKVEALKRTRFASKLHYAWDRMDDGIKVLRGMEIAPRGHVYVLIGFDTTEEEDLYRCQKIIDFGHDPYIMPYNQSKAEKKFKRFIDSFMWRKFKTLDEAWKNYNP